MDFEIEAPNTAPTLNLQLTWVIEVNPNEYDSASDLNVVFDATGSVDPDGTITRMVVEKEGAVIYNGPALSFWHTAIWDFGKTINYKVTIYDDDLAISAKNLKIVYNR